MKHKQQDILEKFEVYLASTLPTQNNQKFIEAVRYSLCNGGKRIRPLIIFTIIEAFQNDYKKGFPFAAALEYIHTYSLIHDDLPCMDDAQYRRGKLTNHLKFGEDIALLVGDALLTQAFYLISDVEKLAFLSTDKILKIIHILSKNAGIQGMVGGQYLDISYVDAKETFEVKKRKIQKLHHLKTACMFQTAFVMGGYLADINSSQITILEKIGKKFGLCYQIHDDIIDNTSTLSETGKDTQADIKNKKFSFLSLYSLHEAQTILKKELQYIFQQIEQLNCRNHHILKELLTQFIYNVHGL